MSLNAHSEAASLSFPPTRLSPPGPRPAWRVPVETRLRQHPMFEGVEPHFIEMALRAAQPREALPGQVIAQQGVASEGYWLLCTGAVRSFMTSTRSKEVSLRLYSAPSAWGQECLLHALPVPHSTIAVVRSELVLLPKETWLQLMSQSTRFSQNVLCDSSAQLWLDAQLQRVCATWSVLQRVAHVLLAYQRVFGLPVEGGTLIRIRLGQEQLARDLGVALKSTARAAQELHRSGLLRKRQGCYLMPDVTALAALLPTRAPGIDWVSVRTLA